MGDVLFIKTAQNREGNRTNHDRTYRGLQSKRVAKRNAGI